MSQVKIGEESVVIPTYQVGEADKKQMKFMKRRQRISAEHWN